MADAVQALLGMGSCLSMCCCACVFLSLCLCLCLGPCVSVCLRALGTACPVSACLRLFGSVAVHLSVLSVWPCACLYVAVCVHNWPAEPQRFLHPEEMVPELQQFVEHDILSKGEVRALVKKRTDFEYRLRRRAAEKRDFERYIEYEMTFERLLKSRRERLGVKKGKGTGKFSCVKHIHFIFDRAVKKFRGDIDLWLEWIAYAKSEMSSKVLSKIFARALQLHPRNAKLWVHAAAYEWDMGNVTASRTLLQRGIRLNSKAEELWREYFRMEVLFTARLAERRRVLGLGKSAKKIVDAEAEGESAIAIGDLDEEGKGGGAVALPETQSVEAGLEELLAGSIPKAVVRYARETMQSCPLLFFGMYDLCYLAGDAARSALEEEILAVIDEIATSPAPPASSVASSEAAVAAAADATAAAFTGSATRRAARAMAQSAADGGEEAVACDAAQEVLNKYLEPYRAAGTQLSPRKSAKGVRGGKVATSSSVDAQPQEEAGGKKMQAGTYEHIYRHGYIHNTYIHTYMHVCMHVHMCKYIHTHTYT